MAAPQQRRRCAWRGEIIATICAEQQRRRGHAIDNPHKAYAPLDESREGRLHCESGAGPLANGAC